MNKAKIIATAPIIYVENVEESLAFYIKNLGFQLINKVPNIYGMVQRDGFQIHLAKATDQFPTYKQHILIWIPEIDLFWEEMKTKKITILDKITLKPYGNREFIIEDNNGNALIICD